jgi:hypothetical protein
MATNLPQRIETTIKSIDAQGNIQLNSSVPAGMSGIVIHDYGNGLSAITHSLVSKNSSKAEVLPYTAITHENIPTVKTMVKVNDKVIIGNFYNNVLLIAPNARSYEKIKKRFKKIWIHPDAYALDFMKEEERAISKKSLNKFAKANQIGLVLIATNNRLLILDPISQQFIGEQKLDNANDKAMKPFFSRFEQMDVSAFGWSKTKLKEYSQAIKELE